MSLFAHDVRGHMESKKDSLSKNQTNTLSVIYGFIQIAAEEKQTAFIMKTKKILSYDDNSREMMWLWKSEEEFFKDIIEVLESNGFNVHFWKYSIVEGEEDNFIVVDWASPKDSV